MTEPVRGDNAAPITLWPAELDAEYVQLGELGRGGMAVVFRARDRELGRDVAIKVVKPRFSADDEAVARLVREAKTVAQLQHPNIVSLYGIKHLSDRSVALIMQLVPGRTLKAQIQQGGPLDPARAERILQDIAKALAFAHKAGVVHRDVKPENIFLDEVSGRALLSDFGVARAMDASNELTATGTTIGTPTYMPPEQIDGLFVDGRSDLYSLGMVAWEMLTGQRPWAGESLYGVIYRQKHDPLPPIDGVRKDVPAKLLYLIEGLMPKNPERRWSSAARLLSLLASDEEPPGIREWQEVRRRQRRTPMAPGVVPSGPAAPQETVRFVRGQPQVSPGAEAPTPPSVAEPPEPPEDTAFAFPVDESRDADPDERSTPRERAGPSIRQRMVALAVVLTLTAGWLGWQIIGREARVHNADARVTVGADDRAIEVPVLDSMVPTPDGAVPSNPVLAGDSTGGAGTPGAYDPAAPSQVSSGELPPLSDTVIDTARAFLQWLATQGAGQTAARDTVAARRAPVARNTVPPPQSRLPAPRTPAVETTPQRVPPSANDPTRSAASRGSPPTRDAAGGDAGGLRGAPRDTAAPAPTVLAPPPPPTIAVERRAIASGARHSCRIRDDGRAECWGNNDGGQLGDGGFDGRAIAGAVAGDFRFTQLSAGFNHTCGVTTDGGVLCWGANSAGQLGDGTTAVRAAPVRVNSRDSFAAVRTGQTHTCALSRTGIVQCWGGNTDGQLGTGGRDSRPSPTIVGLPSPATALTTGAHHTCAITRDGSVYCWGRNDDGQLGDGTSALRVTPVPVSLPGPAVSIAAGSAHTCVVGSSGGAWCWGRNTYGQLGVGTAAGAAVTPRRVASRTAFSTIVAGSVHTCARGLDGSVWCWGRNAYGQVGDGTTVDRPQPVEVPGVTPVQSLDAGAAHTCATQSSGTAFCWGYNVDGQVGRGDRENALAPARVTVPPR